MAAGMAGLAMGYGLLMLSPGNVIRMKESGETFQFLFLDGGHLLSLGFCFLVQSFLWMYLWMAYRRRKYLQVNKYGRHIRLASWFAVMSMLFNLIMLFLRSPLSGLPFPVSSFDDCSYADSPGNAAEWKEYSKSKGLQRTLSPLDFIFCFTFSTSVVQYYNQRLYMGNIIRQAESLSRKNLVLKVTGEPDVLKNGYCSQVCMLLIRLLRRMSTTGGMWPLPDIMISREFTGKRQLICRIGYYFL